MSTVLGIGRQLGSQPPANTSITIIRAPQRGDKAVELVAEAAVEAGLSRQEARTVTRRGVRAGLAEVSSGA